MKVRQARGFTIIEIMVVIVVIGILASIVSIYFISIQAQSRDSKREGDMRVLRQALQRYYDANGEYPFTCEFSNNTICATTTTAYTSAVGTAPISSISASTTVASLQTLLSPIDASFGDPRRGNKNTINVPTTTNTVYISKNSYLLLSMDLYNRSGTVYLATNDTASSSISCNFNSVATTKSGATNSGASHYYIMGYFSESQNKWIFYQGPYDVSLNNLQWNYDNQASCAVSQLS